MPVDAWHFLRPNQRLRFPPRTLVKHGQTLTATKKPIELLRYGLHGSRKPLDALIWAPSMAIVCRARLHGEILEGERQLCATHRTCLWMARPRLALHEFALWGARVVLNRTQTTNEDAWAMIRAKETWLQHGTGRKRLKLARDKVHKYVVPGESLPPEYQVVWTAYWCTSTNLKTALWYGMYDARHTLGVDEQNTKLHRELMKLGGH